MIGSLAMMLSSIRSVFNATSLCTLTPVTSYPIKNKDAHALSMASIPEVIATAGGKSSKADPESSDPVFKSSKEGSKSTTLPTNGPNPLPNKNGQDEDNQDENTNSETNGKSSKTNPKTPKEDSGSKSGKDKSKTTRPTKKPTRSPSTSSTAWTICSTVSCEANDSCDLVDG
jgi:hypothetical protein